MLNLLFIGVPWEFPSNGVHNATHLTWGKDLGSLLVLINSGSVGDPPSTVVIPALLSPAWTRLASENFIFVFGS